MIVFFFELLKVENIFESYFKRLYESPEENSDSVTLTQQLDESSSSEESQEADIDEIFLNKKQTFLIS